MPRLWLKFCGLVRPADFDHAISLGADAVGIIAVPSSPRFLALNEAAVLGARARGASKLTLVLQDPDSGFAREYIAATNPDLLQFHGAESEAEAAGHGLPYIKATRTLDAASLRLLRTHEAAWALMLDSPEVTAELLAMLEASSASKPCRCILAGGLTVQNLAERLSAVTPFGIDVSRGIESSPRVKDQNKMTEFAHAVRANQIG
jgi:phosphoribosylanthranilate isomerase